ncbi:PREDICTED: protein RTF2 homolog [Ipomoea nil]|uniref:protein RTF2 homolog n=1 Tax=Ipomoea nil TaxID=35883 RepID=UPI000900A964|nr:PREDICTED: protein RTF2 homolog [Ipomoea nil]
MDSKSQNFQIFIQSPDLKIPTRAISLESPNPGFTIKDLKAFIFSKTLTLIQHSGYFTLDGKLIPDSTPVNSSLIAPLSTLTLRLRFLGGGGDGGATGAESRDCYLKMYAEKKPDKIDPNEVRLSKWLNCTLSNEPLKHPVVIDKLGNLFNKEALVEALLKKQVPKQFAYIKGLRDMIPIELSAIPGMEDSGLGFVTRFQCPISGLEFNGKYKFFALRPCGHVFSAKALKEVKSSACLVCHKEFMENEKIVINGNEDEVAALKERMVEENAKLKDNKKSKKGKNGGDVAVNGEGVEVTRLSGTKHGIEDKVFAEKGKSELNRKNNPNGKIEVKNVTNGASNGSGKRFKAGENVPANATKEVYASIFTSSRKSDFKETYSCRSLPLGRN